MGTRNMGYNCGATELGGWERYKDKLSPKYLEEVDKEIETQINQAKAGWRKLIICTVLKEQEPIRKLLRKHGFKKTPETKSKYKESNTQCIYYWDTNALKKKETK
jgi:hypothetical protein